MSKPVPGPRKAGPSSQAMGTPQRADGFDISVYQMAPNLDGAEFVIVRATYGTDGVDTRVADHVRRVRSQPGRKLGMYHFAYPDPGDASKEAGHFLATALRFKPDFLALDFEVRDGLEGQGDGALDQWAEQFLTACKATGLPCLFYTFASWLHIFGRTAQLVPNGLWVAEWQVHEPRHAPWANWRIWQTGGLRGLDHNVYNGSRDQLVGWLGAGGDEDVTLEQMQKRRTGIQKFAEDPAAPNPFKEGTFEWWGFSDANQLYKAFGLPAGGGGGGLPDHAHDGGKTGGVAS